MAFSFFGDESKLPAAPRSVSISVKKTPSGRQLNGASNTSPGPSRASSDRERSTVTPRTSSNSLPRFTSGQKSLNGAGGAKKVASSSLLKGSSTSRPTSGSGTPKTKQEERVRSTATPRTPSHSSSPSRLKRKTPQATQIVESESSSGSESESSDDALDPKPRNPKKRSRTFKNGSGSSTPLLGEKKVGRRVFCWDKVDMRGEWGRGWVGFVGSEEVVGGQVEGWAGGGGGEATSKTVKYTPFFPQTGFDTEDGVWPSVEILYPAKGCKETFQLIHPVSNSEFAPMAELKRTLSFILERKSSAPSYYIPPSHRHIFGTLKDSLDLSVRLSAVPSRVSSPLLPSLVTPPPDVPSPSGIALTPESLAPPLAERIENIGDLLRISLAPNRLDGPLFRLAISRYNAAMQAIQSDGTLQQWLSSGLRGGRELKLDDWKELVAHVHDTAYQRVVGPYTHELAHPGRHPEDVAKALREKEDSYGELKSAFMSRILEQTKLGPDSVFVDLGSGVGNCVLQASLQAGCRSYGFELLPTPAHCARLQLKEVQRRWAMWALEGNLGVEVGEGDFTDMGEVGKCLRDADVVLVNNEVFPSSLNQTLCDMFLDLKDGAIIVSLKPFVEKGFRINSSNCDRFAACLRSTQHEYWGDWVSWKGDGGYYYIAVKDPSERAKFVESMSKGRRG
ncbi:histone-lysine N-methyltransferase, H3 lysine-79 specific [Cryptococcus wingfieldii CBS 7118]|uniref:Histone-lysine N-methyltransferase, H3 lysine-79 specific n=1 Tax=Cryptococcus wingfieldii CBS 7118 TaxID=1295528 RepID=A0A1E3JM72_9TREE|nr:histone-lysine N-methyltransferase, H3 lysine-79 specific [Cryptococcus wingfieldii CBS 7118]ODO01958.1 histone-lysine N-methyltransferase, H3 lysine-79 specific [Cryptococcus wingfieldii CBS 7118]